MIAWVRLCREHMREAFCFLAEASRDGRKHNKSPSSFLQGTFSPGFMNWSFHETRGRRWTRPQWASFQNTMTFDWMELLRLPGTRCFLNTAHRFCRVWPRTTWSSSPRSSWGRSICQIDVSIVHLRAPGDWMQERFKQEGACRFYGFMKNVRGRVTNTSDFYPLNSSVMKNVTVWMM